MNRLRHDAGVLDRTLVARAMEQLDDTTRRGLIDGLNAPDAAARRGPPAGHPGHASCESCGMPIERALLPVLHRRQRQPAGHRRRFAAMVAGSGDAIPSSPRVIEEQTRAYMASLPAWRGHPRLTEHAIDDC